jgi:1-acyl-sn-glycerol-3-phosphate acyltransferase
MSVLRNPWYGLLYRLASFIYFARITVVGGSQLPRHGPVLYVGLHRNGALDGFVYHVALGGPTFMISTQLRRNWFARLIFTGIAVTRAKDEGDRGENQIALQECVALLRSGGELFVFPEGTSSLGPRHLPFKSGAAWLILDYLNSAGPPLQVVPVGIHYECPWAFRAKVEVVVGAPISITLDPQLSPRQRIRELKQRIQDALHKVGINVVSEEYQENIQRLAYASTLATPRSYLRSLKALERVIPDPILRAGAELEPRLRSSGLWRHQGVPLFPMGSVFWYILLLLVLAPVVLAALAVNLPPYFSGWFAGKKFPDDRNVISLWKVLIGIPVFFGWALTLTVAGLWLGRAWLVLAYLLLTWAGLELYYRVKKLAVAVYNGLRYPGLRSAMLSFRQTVLNCLPAEPPD